MVVDTVNQAMKEGNLPILDFWVKVVGCVIATVCAAGILAGCAIQQTQQQD